MTNHLQCPHCAGLGYITEKTSSTGSLLAYYRKKQGITQGELAAEVGVSRGQVANIEAERYPASISILRSFAAVLKISFRELIP